MIKPKYPLSRIKKKLRKAMWEIEFCDEKINKDHKKEIMSFVLELQGMCSALDRIMILKDS